MKPDNKSDHPFRLDFQIKNRLADIIFRIFQLPLEYVLNLSHLGDVYHRILNGNLDFDFCNRALKELNVQLDVKPSDLAKIPATGRVVVVGNHPFGAIEGIILAALFSSIRQDFKILANFLLSRIVEMRDLFIFVDPFGGTKAKKSNIRPLIETIRWLESDKLLGVFPAGEVAHLHLRRGVIMDPPWTESIAAIIRKTESPVVPLYFDGHNSVLFHLFGMLNPKFRTALLPRELINKRSQKIKINIGKVIPFAKLSKFETDRELIDYLRFRTYLLSNTNGQTCQVKRKFIFFGKKSSSEIQPLIAPVDACFFSDEIDRLPENQKLLENDDFCVYFAATNQIPYIFQEIGRLREQTFREAGEGTGRMLDIDQFDPHYLHLFCWNRAKKEIVGAYRLGLTDKIIENYGIPGLYTSTLFIFKLHLFKQINPALELGRSFVRKEYQRSYAPLMLLWKGIGQFVAQNPRYKTLFGPVSINQEYLTVSQHLMIEFLRLNNYLPSMAKLVKPRTPIKSKTAKQIDLEISKTLINSIEQLSDLVSDIEEDQKGIPILIKQYLKLGGKFIGFNIDPDFSNVLDGLIIIDLTRTDHKILEKYMGKTESAHFLNHNQNDTGQKQ